MDNRSKKTTLLAGVAAALCIAGTARGQDVAIAPRPSPNPEAAASADIIVTARRSDERLQDVPISITVYNQQQLANRNIITASDLATYTPSLSANNYYGSQNTTFAVRGFVQDVGTQPSVGVYFADVVAPRGASNNIPVGDGAGPGDLFDLQNVQVLKGPQGTLFGRNTTGGAILLVPQKPTSTFGGYVEGSYGDYDLKRIQGVVNIPLSDSARLRLGVDHESRNGYVNNLSGMGPQHFNDIDYTAVRASLVVDLTPNLENYLIASYARSDTTGDIQKLETCLPNSALTPAGTFANLLGSMACAQLDEQQGIGRYDVRVAPSINPRTLLTQWRLIDTTTWRVSDAVTIKNIVSYAQLREVYREPFFETDFDYADTAYGQLLGLPRGTTTFFSAASNVPNGDTAAESTFTEELHVGGSSFGNKLQWQSGAYFEVASPLELAGSQNPILNICADLANLICNNPIGAGDVNYTVNKTSLHNVGLYGQGTYSLTDRLKLTGGIRYTWDSAHNFNILRSYQFPIGTAQMPTSGYFCNDPTVTTSSCSSQIQEKSQRPTWLIDLDYKLMDHVLVYGKWARGYRAGNVQAQGPAGYKTFAPESVDDYDVGLKSSIEPLRATFNIAGFYNNLRDQQLLVNLASTVVGLAPASAVVNAGKSRIWGVELETSIKPVARITLQGDYTYLNTSLREVPASCPTCVPYSVIFYGSRGDPLRFSPKNKFSITGTYEMPIDAALGTISISATFTHSDRQLASYGDDFPTVLVGGTYVATPASNRSLAYLQAQNLLNLNLNWIKFAGSRFDLSLFVTNVTNQYYFTYSGDLFQAVQFETVGLGEPRMFGGRVKVNF